MFDKLGLVQTRYDETNSLLKTPNIISDREC